MLLAAAEALPSSTEGAILQTFLSVGPVGVFFLMFLLRWKVMPTYVFDDARREWERERSGLERDLKEVKAATVEAQRVYVEQVIPTLTRVLDELRKAEDRRNRGG